MNTHLNIFKPFSHDFFNKDYIEKNLSRAFVLCLKNNSLLFHEFLRTIFTEAKQEVLFENLFLDITDEDAYSIDIEVDTASLQGFTKVFALSMAEVPLDMNDFLMQKNGKIRDI